MKKTLWIIALTALLLAHIYTQSFVTGRFSENPGCDFWCYWTASKDFLHGESPYAKGEKQGEHYYLYPPLLATVITPLALIENERTAFALWTTLGVSAYLYGLFRCGRPQS